MKSHTLKATAISLILFFISGCAISMAGTQEHLAVRDNLSNNNINNSDLIKFTCDAKLYSIMLSLVIPLPPVIPVPRDNNAKLIVTMPKGINVQAFLAHENDLKEHQLQHIENITPQTKGQQSIWIFPIDSSCEDLKNSILKVIITNDENQDQKEKTYKLEYSNEGLKLNFGYLSA